MDRRITLFSTLHYAFVWSISIEKSVRHLGLTRYYDAVLFKCILCTSKSFASLYGFRTSWEDSSPVILLLRRM